jgi:hypothetical protein
VIEEKTEIFTVGLGVPKLDLRAFGSSLALQLIILDVTRALRARIIKCRIPREGLKPESLHSMAAYDERGSMEVMNVRRL